MKQNNVSIIVPVCNYELSKETLLGLSAQEYPGDYEVLIIADKGEPSKEFKQWLNKTLKGHYTLIINKINHGLAYNYNEGINLARYDKLILIHEDCVPKDSKLIKDILNSLEDYDVVNGLVLFPKSILDSYDFWNRMLLFRYTNLKCQALGKITGFNRSVFFKVGYFDFETYRTAGEDMDFMKRCAEEGVQIGQVDNYVIHKHRAVNASFKSVLSKAWQLGEGHGAYKRKYGLFTRLGKFDFEWRTICLLLIPLFGIGLIPFFLLATYQAIKNYKIQRWLPGLLAYPFIGTVILITATLAAIKSYATGRQTL